jgi:ATP-dependent protease ClpP protease subunit
MIRPVRRASGLLAVLATLVLSPLPARALDIRNDPGGPVEARIAQLQALRDKGTPVRIIGTCLSACTLLLGLAQTCVMPDARLGFHGPSTRLKGIPLPREEFERVSRLMAEHYPEPLRRWFLAEARMRTDGYITLRGWQAIAMGARACD